MKSIKFLLIAITLIFCGLMLGGCKSNDLLTNNPDSEDVKNAIVSIEHIVEVEIVTEENDPNGRLGEQGGYTGALYFTYDLLEGFSGRPTEIGTIGGGCIEIYENSEDAEARNNYLSVFDGALFVTGSHIVVGTLVIRTSSNLTAKQQDILEKAIIDALT